jgi:RNA polymerase primary sigma factor
VSRPQDSGPDGVRLYLDEIGQVDLLTAEQERTLGQMIRTGLDAQARLDTQSDDMDPAERRALERTARKGREAKDDMVCANLRLVVSIARRYDRRELQLADLIQEGNIGLMHAAEKYDHTKGFKFSSYATWWIRQAMSRAMADQGRNIRIPGHMMEIVLRVQRAERDLAVQLGRDPSPEEVADRCAITLEKLFEVNRISIPTASLDAPVGSDNDDLSVGDTIASVDDGSDPGSTVERRQLAEAIASVLSELPVREQRILAMRFGIGEHRDHQYTLEEVAEREGVTRERVRQIEQKTLARLRHPNSSANLRSFVGDE